MNKLRIPCHVRSVFPALLLGFTTSCAFHHSIQGTVLDRNGEPVERVIVSLDPGGVELVTDEQGNFLVDYLRDSEGNRVKLARRTDYTVEAFKVGYHLTSQNFYYKRGELTLEILTLNEDTIRIDPSDVDFDPASYPDRTHSAGSSYEGE
ncbi:MAG: carboxypeptidase-like regulatory domain-containing protein [Myxococcota bacterium]|jgi:hypothetical protein|nr:carboxypeptidase-like regulatory domain-containing protein [Myxococcota bacterium]